MTNYQHTVPVRYRFRLGGSPIATGIGVNSSGSAYQMVIGDTSMQILSVQLQVGALTTASDEIPTPGGAGHPGNRPLDR